MRVFERSAEIMNEKEINKRNDDETMINNFSDVLLPSIASVAKNINYSFFSLHNNSLTSYGDFKIPQNASKNIKIFNGKIFALVRI